MIKKISLATLAISTLFLQGCATLGVSEHTEFSCNGGDTEGVSCLSASEIYKATNDKEYLNKNNINEQIKEEKFKFKNKIINTSSDDFESEVNDYYNRRMLSMGDAPVPIRTQQGVMRVWVSPWVDSGDQLHSGEYVFKNITDSEWLIGAKVELGKGFGKSVPTVFSKQKAENKKTGDKIQINSKKKGFDNAVDFMNRMK